jgi:hypothetical protein
MLFKQSILNGIAEGRITVAFRRWRRPSVKAGGSLMTSIGMLRINSVDVIDKRQITPKEAKQAGFDSVDDVLKSVGDREGQLHRIAFRRVGDDPRIALRQNDDLSDDDFSEIQSRLARLDRGNAEPWTVRVLRLIEQFPEQRAVELARRSGFEKEWLKLNVRKLKNLGLTESLDVGYRLSPRGRAFLKSVGNS